MTCRRVHSAGGETDALLMRDGWIAALGDDARRQARRSGAQIMDLAGATITPGLIDAHVHLTEWALTRDQTDLSAAASPQDAAILLRGRTPQHDPSRWVRGRGWSAHQWNGTLPDRFALDSLFPDQPVALQSHDMHSLWLNSAALTRAGIGDSTPDPHGGKIVRDEHGAPTGLLLETAAQLVLAYVPVPTVAEAIAAVTAGQAALHQLGFTGVHSFPGIHIPDPDPFAILQRLHECDVLRLRVLQHFAQDRLDSAIELGIRSGFGDDWLRIGGVKLFLDGALGSRTAWMREPYEASDSCGVNVLPREALREIVVKAAAAGIACTVHAIGDAAVTLALDELSPPERAVAALPHRIEHVQCCPPERMKDFARANIICSVQPCHLMSDWRAADQHWGGRSSWTYAFGSLLANGAILAFGSDAPVEPIDPRRGLFAAVRRMDDARMPSHGWYADERISAPAALHAYTAGPAIAAGTQTHQGVLRKGAWADFVAWDVDPLAIDPDDMTNLRCVATVVGGTTVFS
ncbi:MAG: amidohydrolase [Longimicrobiales bacterium]